MRGAAWAFWCAGAWLLCANCDGKQPLPPRFPLPSPSAQVDLTLHCHDAPSPRAPSALLPVPFDAAMSHWPDRTGAFQGSQPMAAASVRAQDVALHPSEAQRGLLSNSASRRVSSVVPIGGDYWADTPYPIGPTASAPWVSSGFHLQSPRALPDREPDALVGELTSAPFELGADYLRAYIGGDRDPGVGVELLVKPQAGKDLSGCDKAGVQGEPSSRAAGFVLARVLRGTKAALDPDREQLEAVEVSLGAPQCDLRGLTAILRVVDHSGSAHVSVGTFALTDAPLTDPEKDATPLWGLADLHTHPTDFLGLGGLQGIHVLWGAPGGGMHEYVGDSPRVRARFAADIPSCDNEDLHFNGHHGGLAAPIMINAAEGRLAPSIDDLNAFKLAYEHGSKGGPSFENFPDFRAGAHEQYHISQIHRAYLGGLRLMSALAIHNRGLEYGAGWVRCGDNGRPTVDTTSDWTVIRAHARAMKQLAQLNREWMEIAYSPADARRIIKENKLAVVLGVEVPQLGDDEDGSPAEQVRDLESLGIRQVVLVHGMDNLLGGTAIFQDLYNSVNDWMYRPQRFRDRVETLSGITIWTQFPATFFDVTSRPSPPVTSLPYDEPIESTEPIVYRLANPERVVLSDLFPRPPSYPFFGNRFGDMHPLVSTTPLFEKEQNLYDERAGGHRNTRGLTGRGAEFVQRLMQRGMLIDLAHMSDATLANTYDVAEGACGAYPLMISHAHFRPLAMKVDYSDLASDFTSLTAGRVRTALVANREAMDACVHHNEKCDDFVRDTALQFARRAPRPGTTSRENLPREYDVPSSEIQQVRQRDGVIGVFLGQGALDAASFGPGNLPGGLQTLPVPLDCAGSSQGLGAALLFANARMKGKGALGIASDFTFTTSMVPRFGPHACAGYMAGGASSQSGAQLLETLVDPDHYRFGAQKDAVNYASPKIATCADGVAKSPGMACGANAPLEPSVMGDRTYDFNVDGFAHYGLVPDVLQDVANQLHEGRHLALDPLFRSADAYLEMWRAARRLSDCEANGLCPEPDRSPDPQCLGTPVERPECGYSCPCGWNHGAPLQELAEVHGACDPGKPITFPAERQGVAPQLKYQQRRTDPRTAGDLSWQGDWAIYKIPAGQTWQCGGGPARALGCPAAANYVKVRRLLDTTVSRFTERCDEPPLPPEDGNRSVLFQCLLGPDEGSLSRPLP
jgi:microsomal dipeptidase-like Zn-dependent dipeptidase